MRCHDRGVIVTIVQEVRGDFVVCLETLWFKQLILIRPLEGRKMSETLNIHVCPERNLSIDFHPIGIGVRHHKAGKSCASKKGKDQAGWHVTHMYYVHMYSLSFV